MTANNPTPKYVINSTAEIKGAALLTLLQSQKHYEFEDLVKKYNYDNVEPDKWYSYQDTMEFLKELTQRENMTENMVSIGIKVFEVVPLLENVSNIGDGLAMMNTLTTTLERNVERDESWYTIQQIDNTTYEFIDKGPLPHDLIYGELYALAIRLRPEDSGFTLTREYLNEDEPDLDGAVYHITIN